MPDRQQYTVVHPGDHQLYHTDLDTATRLQALRTDHRVAYDVLFAEGRQNGHIHEGPSLTSAERKDFQETVREDREDQLDVHYADQLRELAPVPYEVTDRIIQAEERAAREEARLDVPILRDGTFYRADPAAVHALDAVKAVDPHAAVTLFDHWRDQGRIRADHAHQQSPAPTAAEAPRQGHRP